MNITFLSLYFIQYFLHSCVSSSLLNKYYLIYACVLLSIFSVKDVHAAVIKIFQYTYLSSITVMSVDKNGDMLISQTDK